MKRTTLPMQCELFAEYTLEAMIVRAVDLLIANEPPGGYYGCFSGGKDSCVIKELARLAGVKATWHYNVTTVDPPELVRYIVDNHPDVERLNPGMRMFDEIPKRGLPTRRIRWCCEVFKERRSPKGATLIMGIRAEESPRRASMWSEVEYHRHTKCNCVLPIFHWTIDHVWEFIRVQKLQYCSLYDEGFRRLGCVGCPMAGVAARIKAFSRWPGIEQQYKDATRKLFETNRNKYVQRFPSWDSLWEWWLSDDAAPAAPCGELKLFEPEAEP
jgi:phosphoadenosine phosphosulfate reductase